MARTRLLCGLRGHSVGRMSDDAQLELFSQGRLEGYADTQEHEDNLFLISQIAHKIGILEIVIRNKIDILLSEKDKDWINNIVLERQNKDEIISRQTMGFWVKVARYHKVDDKIFDTDFLDSLDFTKYFFKNKNRFKNTKEFRRYQKARAILELLRLIRNRAFHFENLYKFTKNNYPRLNVAIVDDEGNKIYVAIQPDRIKDFLNDLLASFHADLMDYAENQDS
ncbi:MAG: hypothetical protein K2F85_07855 [Helicobacter sp.]|nr:hypothetical protein [Helicobacter sp.]